jgi:c-di-GMP-binding flagellar brake protein YcgR
MSADRRRDPRIELFAEIEIPHEGSMEIVRTHDVSLGGVFLALSPGQCPWMVVGKVLEMALVELPLVFADENAEEPVDNDVLVRARGKVVRRTAGDDRGPAGVGISFVDIEPVHRERLARMIDRASQPTV